MLSLRHFLVLALALATLACTAAPGGPAGSAAPPVDLKFGIGFGSISPSFTPVYLAEEQGLFKANNVNMELVHLGGATFIQAATSGEVKVGSVSTAAAVGGIAKDAPLKIVAVTIMPPNWVLFARKGSNIGGPQDLKGKKVIITGYGGSTHQMAAIVADRNAWDLQKDLTLLPVSSTEAQIASLQRAEADASIMSRERALDFESRGLGNIAFEFASMTPVWADYVMVAHTDLIKNNPDAVRRTLRAYFQGAQLVRDRKDLVIKRLVEVHKFKPEVAEEVYKELQYTKDGSFDVKAMEVVVDNLVKVGALDKKPNMESLYTTQFLPVKF
ncbi:MAG: ABC transporter substrate-binding protein [Chloroflexi bacterium]|nr:ABC transporter substrate-binding protein [Chloroflexota bacterium]